MCAWPVLFDFYCNHKNEFYSKLDKQSNSGFPYYNRYIVDDGRNNKWHLVYFCPSKAYRKKRLSLHYLYTVYEIFPTHKENQSNYGKGVLLIFPSHVQKYCMERLLNGNSNTIPPVLDIVPHAINRYTERYLNPRGIIDFNIHNKVENIMSRFQHVDTESDLHGDKSSQKYVKDGVTPFDFVFRDGGMLRGSCYVYKTYIQLYTYVDASMMYDNQIERGKEIMNDYFKNHNPLKK